MLAILGSLLSGGATGLLGVGIQRFFDHKNKKLEIEAKQKAFEHEVALRHVDAEIMQQEWAARTKVAEVEGEAKIQVEDSKAFNTSLTSEPQLYSGKVKKLTPAQSWLMLILDFVRGSVRPVLTIYLCLVTTLVYFQASALMGDSFLPFQAYELVDKIISTILYLTTTACLWWFGTRNKSK